MPAGRLGAVCGLSGSPSRVGGFAERDQANRIGDWFAWAGMPMRTKCQPQTVPDRSDDATVPRFRGIGSRSAPVCLRPVAAASFPAFRAGGSRSGGVSRGRSALGSWPLAASFVSVLGDAAGPADEPRRRVASGRAPTGAAALLSCDGERYASRAGDGPTRGGRGSGDAAVDVWARRVRGRGASCLCRRPGGVVSVVVSRVALWRA